MDLTHLDALRLRLSHERGYLAAARTDKERTRRLAWIAQVEREIAGEMKFLGIEYAPACDMTDDELLAALGV
jgi:hypothetical protein